MAAVKFQVCRPVEGSPALDVVLGIESADFQGHGGQVGFVDAHRTINGFESDPASPALVALVVREGPAINATLKAFAGEAPDFLAKLASVLGLEGKGTVYGRFVVMDK